MVVQIREVALVHEVPLHIPDAPVVLAPFVQKQVPALPCSLYRIALVPGPEDPSQVFGHLRLVPVANLVHHVAFQSSTAFVASSDAW